MPACAKFQTLDTFNTSEKATANKTEYVEVANPVQMI